ncbi:carboxypeptidase-like regulatory domain-containing protein [Winogradskyella tangerina]|uniref:carboxypeptidase-like regulatory domain-containing protein n=1 Tax=Winogradskyella tangerina TaxID=2023240 RepID=UPI000DBE00A4|nr:carboxypeptidase-like regulatory domain-containing protein [Winogradskyella tangerina]
MKTIKQFFGLIALLSVISLHAQRKEIKGQLEADDDVEGIHILNKSAAKFAISNTDGSFTILAKASDTLQISSLKYENKELVITQENENSGTLTVPLVEKVTSLNKVLVGSTLTGSLQSDLENSKAKTDINFYDLGIPGNTKKPLTQNERKLYDADAGPMGYVGLGFGLNFHKLLNKISGRTKKLKAIVELDDRDRCITRLRSNYESIIFENDSLAANLRNEYFLFSMEDENFLNLCKENNEIKLLEYLQEKLIAYRKNREEADND